MDVAFWFPLIKLLHLGGLILWLGPSGGAWLLIQLAKRRLGQHSVECEALYRDFLRFFWVEHFGLLLLMGSGVLLLSMYGFGALDWAWVRWKLALVLLVIVPIEIGDMWFGHLRLPRLFSSRGRDSGLRESKNSLDLYERRFVPLTLPPLLLTVVVIMWLATAKPV
ncbi:MAG: hypothetical protein U9Q81_12775 [Pseudomonadota bacterium]|nr:hypothetical protein [Pseudomonadota bacterium]